MLPHRTTTLSLRLVAALAVAGLLVAGCTGAGPSPSAQAPSATPTERETAMASESEAASASPDASEPAGPATVTVADSDLGDILADGQGNTIYLFTNDADGASTCYDDCAASWPPLTLGENVEPVAGDGVSAELGTAERTDGSVQLTVNGMPVYYYAGDAAAGDVNGQGVGGVWFVMGPDGAMVEGSAAADDPYGY